MKHGVRYIAIASGPIGKGKDTLLIGVIFRNNYIEGLLSSRIKIDGTDSTKQIIRMIKRSRFNDQIRILLFNGIALAGLNIIDIGELEKRLGSKVVLLNRKRQNPTELIKALKELSRLEKIGIDERIAIVDRSKVMKPLKINGMFMQSAMDASYMSVFAKSAFEALRISHIVARGISTGESKGRI